MIFDDPKRSYNARHGFENETEVVAVFEGAQEANHVLLVQRVRLVELVKNLNFLLTRFVHGLLRANHLDGDFSAALLGVLGAHDAAEHAFAEVGVNVVAAAVEQFAEDDAVVPF